MVQIQVNFKSKSCGFLINEIFADFNLLVLDYDLYVLCVEFIFHSGKYLP